MNKDYTWKFFEDKYNEMFKTKQTFSEEMGKHIKEELQRLYKEKEEWLKNKQEEGNEATTENGTD